MPRLPGGAQALPLPAGSRWSHPTQVSGQCQGGGRAGAAGDHGRPGLPPSVPHRPTSSSALEPQENHPCARVPPAPLCSAARPLWALFPLMKAGSQTLSTGPQSWRDRPAALGHLFGSKTSTTQDTVWGWGRGVSSKRPQGSDDGSGQRCHPKPLPRALQLVARPRAPVPVTHHGEQPPDSPGNAHQ